MPIGDNLQGALLISAIDFFLSFVIIGGIGLLLALFPLINRFAKRAGEQQQPCATKTSDAVNAAAGIATGQPVAAGLHPGLSDQELVVILTAAAYTVLGEAVRVEKFRPLSAKDWNWAAQGRRELQSHRLK